MGILALAVVAGNLAYYLARDAGVGVKPALISLGAAWIFVVGISQGDAPTDQRWPWLLASLVSTWVPFVASGWLHISFEDDDPWSMAQRSVAAAVVGIITIPLVAVLGVLASCRLSLGCI